MSTPLELCQDLPRIRMPDIKIRPAARSCDDGEGINRVIPQVNGESEECRTPTAEENKIPAVLSCPPAPRKPRRTASCKRKLLSEFEPFEIVNRDEVESFFRSSFGDLVSKRICPAL